MGIMPSYLQRTEENVINVLQATPKRVNYIPKGCLTLWNLEEIIRPPRSTYGAWWHRLRGCMRNGNMRGGNRRNDLAAFAGRCQRSSGWAAQPHLIGAWIWSAETPLYISHFFNVLGFRTTVILPSSAYLFKPCWHLLSLRLNSSSNHPARRTLSATDGYQFFVYS